MSLNFRNSKLLLVFIVKFIITNVLSDSSVSRYAAVSAVVDNKLYVLGGYSAGISYTTDSLFYIDLTRDFDTTKVPWVDSDKMPVRNAWSVGGVGGPDKSTIFLFGGIMSNPDTDSDNFTNLLYAYDVNTKVWSAPKTTGITPINRRESSIVADDKGKLYIFGGLADEVTKSTFQMFNDIHTLNTLDMNWGLVSAIDPPLPTCDHTSTLLPDGRIVIIGGREGDTNIYEADIYKIKIFDTNNLTWSNMTANGPSSIQPRSGHSAVFSKDGRIIVYGGNRLSAVTPLPEIIVLDTTTNPFQWSAPNFSTVNRAAPVTHHLANLIGDQMIISFGNVTNNFTDPQSSNENTYILDIKDFSWKTSYTANIISSQPGKLSTVQILAIVIAFFVVTILVIVVTFIIAYRKRKNTIPNEMPSEQQVQQQTQQKYSILS